MVCFLVIFVIIIIKITIIIIVATIIIIIKIFSGHTRKTWFLTSKKEDQVARIRGMGGCLGDSGNARKKTLLLMSSLNPVHPWLQWMYWQCRYFLDDETMRWWYARNLTKTDESLRRGRHNVVSFAAFCPIFWQPAQRTTLMWQLTNCWFSFLLISAPLKLLK